MLGNVKSAKQKAVLSSNNPAPKNKQWMEEKFETIKNSDPDLENSFKSKIASTLNLEDKTKSDISIEDKSNIVKLASSCLIRLYWLLTIYIIYICIYQDSRYIIVSIKIL